MVGMKIEGLSRFRSTWVSGSAREYVMKNTVRVLLYLTIIRTKLAKDQWLPEYLPGCSTCGDPLEVPRSSHSRCLFGLGKKANIVEITME